MGVHQYLKTLAKASYAQGQLCLQREMQFLGGAKPFPPTTLPCFPLLFFLLLIIPVDRYPTECAVSLIDPTKERAGGVASEGIAKLVRADWDAFVCDERRGEEDGGSRCQFNDQASLVKDEVSTSRVIEPSLWADKA